MIPGKSPTLDQLMVFCTVAETGSFTLAAERLHRAQSVVSYTIANLEAILGLTLFERGRRKPVLTESGAAVLADARRVNTAFQGFQMRAAGLNSGLEAEVSLAVDVMFPMDRLVDMLEGFARNFPTVALNLRIEALGAVLQTVLEGECVLAIAGPNERWPDAISPLRIGAITLVAVAAPRHPLATLEGGPISSVALRDHTQLVLTDRSRLTEGQRFGVYAARVWRLADLSAKHRLLIAGLGWGYMPLHMVAADIEKGSLVRLTPADRGTFAYAVNLLTRGDHAPGPAARWLARQITALGPIDMH